MDLAAVDTVTGRLYSFLSVTWGLIADVDIESERYRSLGGARFTIGAMARMISKFVCLSATKGGFVCYIKIWYYMKI